MSEAVDVAIDAGQTGVRLGIARGGTVLRSGEGPGLAYGGRARLADAVLERLAAPWIRLNGEHDGHPVGTVCLGLTTALGGDGEYLALARGLLVRLRARRVIIGGDVVTAHAGALGLRPGVVLAAGTGAIALGISADGISRQVDGGGYLYGDAGGGFWIGRSGLDAAMRGHDGRTPPGPLTWRAAEVFGDLRTLADRLYPASDAVAQVAGFAKHVLELSERDHTSASIVTAAAGELAATVAAAGGKDVSWTGRLLRHDGLRRAFEAALRQRQPSARLLEPAGDGLAGAARLAAATDLGPYESLMRTVTR